MDVSSPQSVVLSAAEGPVLRVLAGTTKPLNGREIARLSGTSANGAWKALRKLVEHGLVIEDPVGGSTVLYTLNRDHLAAEPVIALTRLRSLLLEKLTETITDWELQPVHASVFGSAARGDGTTESDVDILIIRPKAIDEEDEAWRAQVDDLSDAIYRWTGNHAGVADISERELPRLRKERPAVITDVMEDGIALVGKPASTIFRTRS